MFTLLQHCYLIYRPYLHFASSVISVNLEEFLSVAAFYFWGRILAIFVEYSFVL